MGKVERFEVSDVTAGQLGADVGAKESYVLVDWDTAWSLVAKALLDTASEHGNEAIFGSPYGGWSNAGVFRPNVLQGRPLNLMGGCTNTQGDWSAGASQVSLPHIIGDMEVYSAQSAWQTIRNHTEVFVLVGCDPIKNNRIEYHVADHGMYAHWKDIRDAGVKFISINPQKTAVSLTAQFAMIPAANWSPEQEIGAIVCCEVEPSCRLTRRLL